MNYYMIEELGKYLAKELEGNSPSIERGTIVIGKFPRQLTIEEVDSQVEDFLSNKGCIRVDDRRIPGFVRVRDKEGKLHFVTASYANHDVNQLRLSSNTPEEIPGRYRYTQPDTYGRAVIFRQAS